MGFCKHCGTEIPEGGACACQAQTAPVTAAPAAPAGPGSLEVLLKNVLNLLLGMVKAPVTTAVDFVKNGDFRIALGFIGVQALAGGLFLMTFFLKLEAAESAFAAFFVGMVLTAAIAFAVPGVVVCLLKVFKAKGTYKEMLGLSALCGIIVAAFLLLTLLVCLVIPFELNSFDTLLTLPRLLILAGTIMSWFVFALALKETADICSDKLVFVMISVVAVSGLILFLGSEIFAPMLEEKYMNPLKILLGFLLTSVKI